MTKEVFVPLIEQASGRVYRVARAILRNDEDCRDALQETALKAWQKRDTLRDEALFGTWLTRILINECHTLLRKKRKYVLKDEIEDGRIDVITLAGILEKELGWIDDWTHEQRAWYTQVLIDNGMMSGDDDIFRMPGKDAVTPEQAIAAAKAEIIRVWELTEGDLKDYQAKWDYLTHSSDKEEKLLHYDIRFVPDARDNGEFTYYCSVAKDGHILTQDENRLTESPAEQKASREKAAHSLDPEADDLLEKYETDHGMDRRGLRYWPLEHQKAMTDLIRPVILEHMQADPLYANELYLYYATHFYGVPDEKAISLEQAVEMSKRALIDQLDVSEDWMARAVCERRVYDVTDEAAPAWKITISGSEELMDEMIETYGKTFAWFVRLNACTGEIVRAQAIDVTVMSYEELIDIWN